MKQRVRPTEAYIDVIVIYQNLSTVVRQKKPNNIWV